MDIQEIGSRIGKIVGGGEKPSGADLLSGTEYDTKQKGADLLSGTEYDTKQKGADLLSGTEYDVPPAKEEPSLMEGWKESFEKTDIAKYLRKDKDRDAFAPVKVVSALAIGIPAFIVSGHAGMYALGRTKDSEGNIISLNDRVDIASSLMDKIGGLAQKPLNSEAALKQFETITKPLEWVETASKYYGDKVLGLTGSGDLSAATKTAVEFAAFFGLPALLGRLTKSVSTKNRASIEKATAEIHNNNMVQKAKADIKRKLSSGELKMSEGFQKHLRREAYLSGELEVVGKEALYTKERSKVWQEALDKETISALKEPYKEPAILEGEPKSSEIIIDPYKKQQEPLSTSKAREMLERQDARKQKMVAIVEEVNSTAPGAKKTAKLFDAYGKELNKLDYSEMVRRQIQTNELVSTEVLDALGTGKPLRKPSLLADESGALHIEFRDSPGSIHRKLMKDDAAYKKVHDMEGRATAKGFKHSLAEGLSQANIHYLDRFGALPKYSDKAYKGARTHAAHKDIAQIEYAELGEMLKPVKDAEGLFTQYVKAKRGLVRAKRGMNNPNKVSLSELENSMAKVENAFESMGRSNDLQIAIDGFHKWTHDRILKPSLDSGLISKEMYDNIKNKNSFYAAFEILDFMPPDFSKVPSKFSGEYFSVGNENIFRKMAGTERKMANPIDSTIKKFIETKGTIARNEVANLLIDDPAMANIARPVAEGKSFHILRAKGMNPVKPKSWSPLEYDTVTRVKNGKPERFRVPLEVSNAMKQMTPRQAHRLVQGINMVFRKSATTVYVPFTISNAMRDAFMAYTSSPVYSSSSLPVFAYDWFGGLKEGIKHEFFGNSDVVRSYITEGRGGFGYTGTLRKTALARKALFKQTKKGMVVDTLTSPLKVFNLIEKMSGSVELASRVAIDTRAQKQGFSKKAAGFMARGGTIDFNMAGTRTRVLNQWTPFLTARIGGRVTLAKALIERPKETSAKILTAVITPALGTYMWNRLYYSDLYDQIPPDIKDNYFCVVLGEGLDSNGKKAPKYATIAKGDAGQMAWNPLEFLLDSMMDKDPVSLIKFATNWANDVSPVGFAREGKPSLSRLASSIMPPVSQGVLELATGHNLYRDSPTVPPWLEATKAPAFQAYKSTPPLYKEIGQMTNIAPLKIQAFMTSIFAGYGREGLDPHAMLRGLTGRLMKVKGGAIEQRAFKAIEDMEKGYVLARSTAEFAVANKNKAEANKIMNAWNRGINEIIKDFNKEFASKGFREKGGLRKKYTFSPQKKENIMLKKESKLTPIERRLRGKK